MIDIHQHVLARVRAIPRPLVWFRLGAADQPLVERGGRLTRGADMLERVLDPMLAEVPLPTGARAPAPGTVVTGSGGSRAEGDGRAGAVLGELEDELVRTTVAAAVRAHAIGRVLHEGPRHRLRVAAGHHHERVVAPVDGQVEVLEPGAIGVRADASGLPGVFGAGDPVSGRLVVAVERPDVELRAAALDVSLSGAVLVGGARVDVEALTRARAMGVRGIITGGLVGKDLRTYLASEARGRAGFHPATPFGIVVLDGYGKRPIPRPLWDWLVTAQGQEVGLAIDPATVLLPSDTPLPELAPGAVWVRSGEQIGREGRLLEILGLHRHAAGVHVPSARVALLPDARGRPAEERLLPLADLERFEP